MPNNKLQHQLSFLHRFAAWVAWKGVIAGEADGVSSPIQTYSGSAGRVWSVSTRSRHTPQSNWSKSHDLPTDATIDVQVSFVICSKQRDLPEYCWHLNYSRWTLSCDLLSHRNSSGGSQTRDVWHCKTLRSTLTSSRRGIKGIVARYEGDVRWCPLLFRFFSPFQLSTGSMISWFHHLDEKANFMHNDETGDGCTPNLLDIFNGAMISPSLTLEQVIIWRNTPCGLLYDCMVICCPGWCFSLW